MAAILAVPIHGTEDEVLELPKDQLPDDPNEIMQILANELAPLKLWLELAVSYYQQRRMEQFSTVMETSTGEDGPFYQDYYKGDKEGRIALLNCLAAYNTQIAAKSKNKTKKDQHFQIANEHYQNSDKIDTNMALTWCGKGLIFMAKISMPQRNRVTGRGDQATEHLTQAGLMFDSALECDRTCIPALLGLAAVRFNSRQFTQALGLYKEVLRLNPACPPEVRLGLAHCFAALKQPEKAKKAFQRVLSLAPDNVEALMGLAILEMNADPPDDLTEEQKEDFRERAVAAALKLIERAYNASPENKHNAMVLNHLANHFIIRNELDKAYTLAFLAYQNTEVKKMRAESCFHIARTHHMKDQFEQAHKYYEYATHYWPEYVLPQIGLGQTLMQQNKLSEAIACLDKVLKVHPASNEVRKLLGSVCARSGDTARAREHLKKITETEQEQRVDPEVWVELGALHEADAPARALQLYHKARDALKRERHRVPAELLNNMAALYHKLANPKLALAFYHKALAAYGLPAPSAEGVVEVSGAGAGAVQGSAVTVLYNLARLHESLHQLPVADQLYRTILRERPNYLDAYVRLGQMAEGRGSSREASMWYLEALAVEPQHADSWTLLGRLHLQQGDLAQAQRRLEKVLAKAPQDAYANVMLGNIYVACAKLDPESKEQDKMRAKYQQLLSRGLDYYRKVLMKEPNNVFAANGAATVLAQSGRLAEAKRVFAELREVAGDQIPDVWVNLAHMHYLHKEYGAAVRLYKAALDKFYGGHEVSLLQCIARAQFAAATRGGRAGKKDGAEVDRRVLKECKRTLQKAMHLAPRDWSLQFNMALLLKTWAESVMTAARDSHLQWSKEAEAKAIEPPPFSKQDLEQVRNDVMVMRRVSHMLSQIQQEQQFPKEKRKEAEGMDKWGENASKVLPQYVEAMDDMRRQYELARAEIRQQEEALVAQRDAEKADKEEAARAEREAQWERARMLEQRKDQLTHAADFLKAKPRQKKEAGDEFDDFIDDEAARGRLDKNKMNETQEKEAKEKEAVLEGMRIFLADSDDEAEAEAEAEDGDSTRQQQFQGFLNSDDDDDDAGGRAGGGVNGSNKDEEDEDGPRELKRRRTRAAASDDEDQEGDKQPAEAAKRGRGEEEGSEGEGGGGGETVRNKKRKLQLEDSDDEGGAGAGAGEGEGAKAGDAGQE